MSTPAPATTLVASDLDRTLIYSSAALALGMPDAQAPRLLCVEVHESKPLSYMTEDAADLLARLTGEAVFVPTTTRTRKQYQRIQLPGTAPKYAICANGGHILVDGVSDRDWHESVVRRLADECAPLSEIRAYLTATTDLSWVRKHRVAEDLFAYLVVERERLPEDWLDRFGSWAGDRGWTVSLQGRKVYAVPKPLTKSAAVREVARRTGATLTLAAGDSSSTPTCCSPRTGPGARATANWPTATGRHPTSTCSRSAVSRRGRRSSAASGRPPPAERRRPSPTAATQPQQPPPQQPPPPPLGAGAAPAEPPTATADSSFTVSSCPAGQDAGAEDSAMGRLSSKVSPQVRQRYS